MSRKSFSEEFSIEMPPIQGEEKGRQLPLMPVAPRLLAARLRAATAKAHQEVLQPKITGQLASGDLPQKLHIYYLMTLHAIYKALEESLAQYATHSHLCTIYQPSVLARETAIESDLGYYCHETNWRNHSIYTHIQKNPPAALSAYVDRLNSLAKDANQATKLLAHAYVRYCKPSFIVPLSPYQSQPRLSDCVVGDLSGGQAIARSLRKSYKLPPNGDGSAFYEFFLSPTFLMKIDPSYKSRHGVEPDSSETLIPVGVQEAKVLKDWFRRGLDEAGKRMSEEEIESVLEEARYAFELNIEVFASLQVVMDQWEHKLGGFSQSTTTDKQSHHHRAAPTRRMKSVVTSGEKTGSTTFALLSCGLALAVYVALRDWPFVGVALQKVLQ